MAIGFTGTSKGMTDRQAKKVYDFLLKRFNFTLHHGDCVGADAEADRIAKLIGAKVVIHPPKNPRMRAFCKGDKVMKEKEYLIRNRDIVNSTKLLIATPKEKKEVLRSGTWATIRYAKKMGKYVKIFYP